MQVNPPGNSESDDPQDSHSRISLVTDDIFVHENMQTCFITSKAWFLLSQLRPRRPPFSSKNKAISVKDDSSNL